MGRGCWGKGLRLDLRQRLDELEVVGVLVELRLHVDGRAVLARVRREEEALRVRIRVRVRVRAKVRVRVRVRGRVKVRVRVTRTDS